MSQVILVADHLLYFLGRKVFKWKKFVYSSTYFITCANFDDTGNDGEKGKQNCFCFHNAGLLYFKKQSSIY